MRTGRESWRMVPPPISSDVKRVLAARGLRAYGDGFVALLLPFYLSGLGFGALGIGAIVAGSLAGTGILTLWVGWVASRHSQRRLLLAAALLMAASGVAFTFARDFWPLLAVAFVGTITPTSGDAGIFSPLEQTVLAHASGPAGRTALFARYSLVGSLMGALGALSASAPDLMVRWGGTDRSAAIRVMFALYALLGAACFILYRPISPSIETMGESAVRPPLRSKRLVYGLAALFGLDSFGSGFLVQSLLALWLFESFHLSVTATAAILFWSNLCAAASYLLAVPIAQRIGLINTMVFTHLPSNMLLMLVPFAPDLATAIGLLVARSALSQMDVPTRTSYVMAVVRPEERPLAASITTVPKTFAWAAGSMVSGYLLALSTFGWPLLAGGAIKAIYDLLLLAKFRHVRPPEETGIGVD